MLKVVDEEQIRVRYKVGTYLTLLYGVVLLWSSLFLTCSNLKVSKLVSKTLATASPPPIGRL